MAKKLKIADILSYPTNIAKLLDSAQKEGIYEYCNTRYEDLVAIRTPRNEKLRQANEEALQIYKAKDFPWPKAANVKYPLITNACIDFASRIFPAIWQDGDVVKTKFYTQHKDYVAGDRLARYLNYYLAERVPAWADNLDKLTTAYPINGLMLKKVYYDPEVGAVRSDLVFPQDLFVPNEAATLKDAPYFFQRYVTNRRNIISFIRSGVWDAEEDDFQREDMGTNDQPTNATVRSEDKTPSAFADVFEAVEGYVNLDFDHDGYPEPYIVTFVPKIGKIVRVVPRFQEDGVTYDDKERVVRIVADDYFVEYQFMQSPDGSLYALGEGELLLSINQAVDTSINQLLDAGTLNNLSSGWISKNVRLQQGSASFGPGEWKTVNSFTGKLSDNILPLPKSEPSATTFELLKTLVDAGTRIAGAQQISDIQIPSNLSATSSMAIIENGMTGLKSVYKRFHRALTNELRLILQWLKKYPDIQEYQAIAGEGATINDFDLIDFVIPVSDPNMITTISKATKAQQLLEMAQQNLIPANAAAIEICNFAGIDPTTVIPQEMSPAEKIAIQTSLAQLDLLKAQTTQALAMALRAKDQGIGDLYRADTEGVARTGRALADVRNAMTFKEGEKITPEMLGKEIAALAKGAGISFSTPVGRLLGDKLMQSIPEGVEGVEDRQDNDVSATFKEEKTTEDGVKV